MKISKFILLLTVLIWMGTEASAQLRNKTFYVGVMVGATNYKGDLDDNFALKFTRPGLGFMGGYKFHPHMSARIAFQQGWMGASDAAAASDVPRIRRNLSFRSPITELSAQLVYEFFGNNRNYKYRPRYSPYLFGGIAVFAFKPQAKLGDTWFNLQPLGTEGQFLPDCEECPEPYSLVQVSIPFGVGIRYKLTDKIDIGAEIGLRKTFTDYLDDVSGLYPDMDALLANSSPEKPSYQLSDRIDKSEYPQGAKFWNGIRGDDTQDDWYVMSNITATYILDWVKCPKFR